MLTCGEGHPGACHRAWGTPTEASTWTELPLSVSRGAGLGRVGQQAGQETVTKEPSLGHSPLLTGWRGPRTQYPQPAHLENGA